MERKVSIVTNVCDVLCDWFAVLLMTDSKLSSSNVPTSEFLFKYTAGAIKTAA